MDTMNTNLMLYKLHELPAVLAWADELKSLFGDDSPTHDDWQLIGRGAVLISPDENASEDVLAQVAQHAGIKLISSKGGELMSAAASKTIHDEWKDGLVFIRAGEWSADASEEYMAEFHSNLLDFLMQMDPAQKFIVVTSVPGYTKLGTRLRQVGAFDRRFFLPPLTMVQIGQRFLHEVELENCDESLISHPEKVGKIIDMNFDSDRQRGLLLIGIRRLLHREKRQLTMKDMVHFASNGTHEMAGSNAIRSEKLIRRTAYHEAGHAMVAMVESGGRNIPEYASINPNGTSYGVVVESYAYRNTDEERETFGMALQELRVSLAGRAAEEVVYGLDAVMRSSACTDLANATRNAKNLVAVCGFSSNTGNNRHYDNLAVVGDESTVTEDANIEKHARRLLAAQYEATLKTIYNHRGLLDRIACRLMESKILFQSDLEELLKETVQPTTTQ